MKFKLDENLGASAAAVLAAMGHDVHTAFEEGLAGRADVDIFEASIIEGRILVTFDKGFGELSRESARQHSGVILLRLPNQRPRAVRDALESAISRIVGVDIRGAVVVVQPGGVRIGQG